MHDKFVLANCPTCFLLKFLVLLVKHGFLVVPIYGTISITISHMCQSGNTIGATVVHWTIIYNLNFLCPFFFSLKLHIEALFIRQHILIKLCVKTFKICFTSHHITNCLPPHTHTSTVLFHSSFWTEE